ncbi:MAG: glycosyltransferase family A protein [Victivallales bacterium]|nr:glycosyltransferase family A protein [Victivallales bacterium]
MSLPLVTIVMRSGNDRLYIGETFERILSQNFTDFEILNFDSGSDDGTWEIIRKFNPVKSWCLERGDYVPGRVLNEAVRKAAGKIIVFNNSDCIPQNEFWLERLIAPLRSAEAGKISGVFCNQLARRDAFPLVRKDYERAFGDGRIAARWNSFFSLASSAVLRELLLKHPFREDLQYSEDVDWAWRMRRLGLKTVYAADAKVEHSHNYTLREMRVRFYNEGWAEGRIYGTAKGLWRGFLLPCLAEIGRDIFYLGRRGQLLSFPAALLYRLTQRFCCWRGRRDFLVSLKAGTDDDGNK